MAIVFLDGCDHLSGESITKKYTRVEGAYDSSLITAQVVGGRYNSGYYTAVGLAGGHVRFLVSFPSAVSVAIAGLYVDFRGAGAGPVAPRGAIGFRAANSADILVAMASGKSLLIFGPSAVGFGTSLASLADAFNASNLNWNHIEMRCAWSGGANVNAAVYLCGTHALSYTGSITSGTIASGASDIGQCWWGTLDAGVNATAHDDFFILDDQGHTNTTIVGPTARIRRHVVSGDSTPLSWATTSGSSHYVEVDDPAEIDNSNYISTVSAVQDTFTLASATSLYSAAEFPRGGQMTVIAYGASDVSLRMNATLSGIIVSAAHTVQFSWIGYRMTLSSAPGYASWARSHIDNLLVGVELAI